MKTLTVVVPGLGRPDRSQLAQMEAADEYPRVSLYENVLQSDMLDEKYLQSVPIVRRLVYRVLPTVIAQVFEAYIIRHNYDVVITWAERLGIPFALLLKLTGSRTPHITLNSWISKRKKAFMLKLVHSHIDRIILWSSVQRDFAVNALNIAPSKIRFARKFADQRFWRPVETETDMICAVGAEMRDYPTLIEAMNGLDIRCHIAAGRTRGKLFSTVKAIYETPVPRNVTVGPKSYFELRELYARSRFVVVPLLPTDTDNGLTSILEAMAMGKAVICSRTKGQVDIIKEGKTGMYVPQGNPIALREKIQYLWDHPEMAVRIGREARTHIERQHSIEQFVQNVRDIAEELTAQESANDKSAKAQIEFSDALSDRGRCA